MPESMREMAKDYLEKIEWLQKAAAVARLAPGSVVPGGPDNLAAAGSRNRGSRRFPIVRNPGSVFQTGTEDDDRTVGSVEPGTPVHCPLVRQADAHDVGRFAFQGSESGSNTVQTGKPRVCSTDRATRQRGSPTGAGFLSRVPVALLFAGLGLILLAGCDVTVQGEKRPLVRQQRIQGALEAVVEHRTDKQESGVSERESESTVFEEWLRLRTRGDVYHPDLFNYSVAVGGGLSQQNLDTDWRLRLEQRHAQ